MEQSEQIIRYCNENKQKNLVLLVNNLGSHGPFSDYDHAHPVFSPSDHVSFYSNAADNAVAVNNAYDNTIEYLDRFIGTVCDALEGRPFVYIYISDHGEYLGENNIWTRGSLKNYNDYRYTSACLVPFVIAYSPEFENLHPHITAALEHLKNNSSMTIGQGHLFHTILGLFGIKTEYYRQRYDLASPHAKPYDGPKPDGI